MSSVVVFALEGQRIGLPLDSVERVIRMVEVAPLPRVPQIIRGIVNLQGRIIPVVDTRKRFGIPEREIELSDQLLVARTSRRTLAMWVDAVTGVIECDAQDFVTAETVVPGMEYVKGIVKLRDGMILVHDLDTLLSLEEAQSLDDAAAHA